MTDRDEPALPEPAPLCSHCRFPLPKHGGGLRHFGFTTAHQENECLRLLHAEIERLTAALAQAQEDARRYRWLREALTNNEAVAYDLVAEAYSHDEAWLDAAIDAAKEDVYTEAELEKAREEARELHKNIRIE